MGIAVVASLGIFVATSGGGLTLGSRKPTVAPVVALEEVNVVFVRESPMPNQPPIHKLVAVVSITNPTDKQVIFRNIFTNIFGAFKPQLLVPEKVLGAFVPPEGEPVYSVPSPRGPGDPPVIWGAANGSTEASPDTVRIVIEPGETKTFEFETEIWQEVDKWVGLRGGTVAGASDPYPEEELKSITSWILQGIAVFEGGECVITQSTPEKHIERLTEFCKEYSKDPRRFL